MIRFDRILGILLQLRAGKTVAAGDLARQFDVSRRTIYRDMDALSALGVPLYAERGVDGGFRLLPGYFLPPLMFSRGEAVALVLGMALWHSLRARPLMTELENAERKLLAALPDEVRQLLADADKIVGFEAPPPDLLHPEPAGRSEHQVTLLEQDWYYRHARFEPDDGGMTRMTYGADDCAEVFALLRWLGPGAELIEPRAWRRQYAEELSRMLAAHAEE